MQVGELFIDLSLIGGDKLAKGLESANKSLNQIKETGLESAFRLKNVFGQFEDQAQNFSNFGTVLKVFEDQTGLSAVTLQKFQRAFMGVNVSADETRATMLNLQNIMNTIQRGGTVPAAMSEALKRMNIDVHNIKDIYGFTKKFQDVSKTMDVAVGRDIAKDLGISGTMWQGFRNYKGDVEKERAWMSESQIRASANMNAKINIMRTNVEAAFAKILSSASASKALDSIYKITNSLLKLLEAALKLGEKSGALELLSNIFTLIANTLTALMNFATGKIEGSDKSFKDYWLKEVYDPKRINQFISDQAKEKHVGQRDIKEELASGFGKVGAIGMGVTNNVNVTQNITAPDPHTAAKESHKGMTNVMKNISNPRKN
jgi:hypothetical protein